MRLRILLLAALSLTSVKAAAAENLLSNGGFDVSIGGWISIGVNGGLSPYAWQPVDALRSDKSGSLALTGRPGVDTNSVGAVYQCVPATAGASYDLGARIWIPR